MEPHPSESEAPAAETQVAYKKIDERHILRSIWRMGYPSMIGFAATNLYTLADMFWVSRLGADRVAALTFFSAFYWVISSANMAAGTGSVSVISRRYGEKNMTATAIAILEAFTLKIALAMAFGVLGYLLLPKIIHLLGAKGDVLEYALVYGRIMFVSLIFNFPTWTLFTALRGIGQPRYAMVIMIASTVLNAILDPFFIFGWAGLPALGVAGAAWASMISYALTIITGLGMFFAGAFKVRMTPALMAKMHVSTMWTMLKIGIPSAINSTSFSSARMIVMPMIAHFGNPVVAVYGAGNRVIELGIVLIVGLELGMSPLVGHALGAKNKLLAWMTAKKALWLGIFIMAGMGIMFAIAARPITMIFFEDQPYLDLGIVFFRISAMALPFIGIYVLLEGAFTGAGDTVPVMVVGIIHAWALEIPLIWLLAYPLAFGPTGVWWGLVFSSVATAAGFLWWFSKKRWLDKKV